MRFQDGSIPLLLAADAGNAAVCKELLQLLSDQQIKAQKMVNMLGKFGNIVYFDGGWRLFSGDEGLSSSYRLSQTRS